MNQSFLESKSSSKSFVYFLALATLLLLFCLRVGAQLLVANGLAPFLPPMEEWFSGFIEYGQLLILQFLVISVALKICRDIFCGSGFFATPNERFGKLVFEFGIIYFAIMVTRYIIRMAMYPVERWTGGSIPIFFHIVLSLFVIVLALYHLQSFPRARATDRKKKLQWNIRILIVILMIVWIIWQVLPAALAYQNGLGMPLYAVRIHNGVVIPLQDGVNLAAVIYRPQHVRKTPTLLIRIPLSKSFRNDIFLSLVSRIWAEHGYTVVIQGTRGRFGSGGTFCPLKGERSDGIDTLAWLKGQEWFDGQCVMWGGSSFGYSELSVCDRLQPRDSAIEVYESSSNFHKMFYPGGAFALSSALSWAINSHGRQDLPDWSSLSTIVKSTKGLPVCNSDIRAVGKEIPFFREWCDHNQYDSFWKTMDVSNLTLNSQAPILSIAGWYDPFLPSQLDDFSNLRRNGKPEVSEKSRLIIGPWTHAGEVVFPDGQKAESFRMFTLVNSLPWFDFNLKPESASSYSSSAPVRIFVMGKNEWREEREWPLDRTAYIPFFLESDGKTKRRLSLSSRDTESDIDRFTYNPEEPVPSAGGAVIGVGGGIKCQNEIESRRDVLVYTSPRLTKDLEVTGPVNAVLFVHTSAVQTDFTVKLVDVYPSGAAFNICDGILRKSYNNPNNTSSSAQDKIPTQIKVELWPTSHVLPKGHRLRVEISSSNFPHYDRNSNTTTSAARAVTLISAEQNVHHSNLYQSRIILPVIFDTLKHQKTGSSIKEYFDESGN